MINWGKYNLALEPGSEWSMDARHAKWLKASLVALKPTTAVEVGCYLGVSTLAILESGVPDVHLIDVRLTESVRQMAADYGATLYEERSETALPKVPASNNMAVLIDGDHTMPVVRAEAHLVSQMQPRCIIAHDVTAQHLGLGCQGCSWLWHTLQCSGWYCYVDSVPRPDERTARGLLIATLTPEDHATVVQAWRETNL